MRTPKYRTEQKKIAIRWGSESWVPAIQHLPAEQPRNSATMLGIFDSDFHAPKPLRKQKQYNFVVLWANNSARVNWR